MRKVSAKQAERNIEKVHETEMLHMLFKEIWDEREEMGFCYCFETGVPLDGRYYRGNTACYDHVLEKGKRSYPEYKFLKKNIIIIHPDIHRKKTQNIDKCPKIKAYRNKLLDLHEEGAL